MSDIILFRGAAHFDGQSTLTYNFPSSMDLKNKVVALVSASFYNSFFNISSAFGNNKVTLTFPVFTNTANQYTMVDFVWTIEDGYYSFDDLSSALTFFLESSKLCLYNSSTGKYLHFVSLLANTTQYAIQISLYGLPNAVSANAMGHALRSGSPLKLNTATTNVTQVAPRVTIGEAFGKLIGYSPGTLSTAPIVSNSYTSTEMYGGMSDLAPAVNTIDSVLLRCSIVDGAGMPNDLLAALPLSSGFGEMIQWQSPFPLYVKCSQGSTNRITLTLVDNDLDLLYQRDKEMTFVLSIRDA